MAKCIGLSRRRHTTLPTARGSRLDEPLLCKIAPRSRDIPISESNMKTYFAYVIEKGSKVKIQFAITFRLMGGAASRVPENGDEFSAVFCLDCLWIVQYDGNTASNPRDVRNFITRVQKTLEDTAKSTSFKAFPAFVDPTLTDVEAHDKYFSPRTYSRLTTLGDIRQVRIFSNSHLLSLGHKAAVSHPLHIL